MQANNKTMKRFVLPHTVPVQSTAYTRRTNLVTIALNPSNPEARSGILPAHA